MKMMSTEHEEYEEELDARYFQNDIVATAFEIFEKTEFVIFIANISNFELVRKMFN